MLGIGDGIVSTVLVELLSWEKMEGAAEEAGEESVLPVDNRASWAALTVGISVLI